MAHIISENMEDKTTFLCKNMQFAADDDIYMNKEM